MFCPKLFTANQLKLHIKKGSHKKKGALCAKSIAKLKRHMETSHKSDIYKRFKCDQCNKGFYSQKPVE